MGADGLPAVRSHRGGADVGILGMGVALLLCAGVQLLLAGPVTGVAAGSTSVVLVAIGALLWGGVRGTRLRTADPPADRVWPWLAQMGHGRAGWYGYDLWDNAGVPSSSQLLPDIHELSVGDVIADAVGPFGFTVVRLDPGAAIVFRSTIHPVTGKRADPIAHPQAPFLDFTWAFVLRPDGPDACRLVVRVRYVHSPQTWVARGVDVYEMVDAVFTRKMLRGIRARVEGAPGSTVADRGSSAVTRASGSDRLRSSWAALAGDVRRDASAA